MPSTSRGYPYPSGSDDVDIPGDMQALAAAVNTDVGTVVTNAATAQATANAAVPKATYDAHTILAATTDNTPAAVTVGEQTIVGRKTGGNITALTAAETKTLLGLGTAAVVDVPPSGDATSGQVVKGSDSRLSDARTPTAHKTSHQSGGGDELTLAQAQITNLTTDLSAKAPLANPTFTGTPAAPTAAVDTNTTQIATTAFTVAQIADDAVLKTVADAAGDLVVGSAADTFGRLALGTDNHVLTVDTAGSGVAKVGWEDPTANPLTTAAMAAKVNTATVGNLLPENHANGSESGTVSSTVSLTACTIASSNSQKKSGGRSIAATSSDLYSEIYLADQSVTVGQTYTFSAEARANAGGEAAAVTILWRDSGGAGIGSTITVSQTATTSGWTRIINTAVAPDTAVSVSVYLTKTGASGTIMYWDQLGIWEGAGGLWAPPGTPITNLGFYTDESAGRRLFQWDANNARWQQTFGDTGWRDVTSLVNVSGWTNAPTALAVYVRRTLEQSSMIVQWNPGTGSCSGQGVLTLPPGFGPAAGIVAPGDAWHSSDAGAYVGGWYWASSTEIDLQSPATSVYLRAMATLPCTAAWPTTLPGTASGSIPA